VLAAWIGALLDAIAVCIAARCGDRQLEEFAAERAGTHIRAIHHGPPAAVGSVEWLEAIPVREKDAAA
jgi:hypothetical protein